MMDGAISLFWFIFFSLFSFSVGSMKFGFFVLVCLFGVCFAIEDKENIFFSSDDIAAFLYWSVGAESSEVKALLKGMADISLPFVIDAIHKFSEKEEEGGFCECHVFEAQYELEENYFAFTEIGLPVWTKRSSYDGCVLPLSFEECNPETECKCASKRQRDSLADPPPEGLLPIFSKNSHLNDGEIAAIVISCSVFAMFVTAFIFAVVARGYEDELIEAETPPPPPLGRHPIWATPHSTHSSVDSSPKDDEGKKPKKKETQAVIDEEEVAEYKDRRGPLEPGDYKSSTTVEFPDHEMQMSVKVDMGLSSSGEDDHHRGIANQRQRKMGALQVSSQSMKDYRLAERNNL